MSFLQCPECRLTVPAHAYYLRGDECPRCMTAMVPRESLARRAPDATPRVPPPGARSAAGRPRERPRLGA